MKQTLTAVALATGLVGGVFANETVKMPVLSPPTLLDGELTEVSWSQAMRSPAFGRLEIGQQSLDKTEAYVYRSEERLYIGVKAEFAYAVYAVNEDGEVAREAIPFGP